MAGSTDRFIGFTRNDELLGIFSSGSRVICWQSEGIVLDILMWFRFRFFMCCLRKVPSHQFYQTKSKVSTQKHINLSRKTFDGLSRLVLFWKQYKIILWTFLIFSYWETRFFDGIAIILQWEEYIWSFCISGTWFFVDIIYAR